MIMKIEVELLNFEFYAYTLLLEITTKHILNLLKFLSISGIVVYILYSSQECHQNMDVWNETAA